MYVNNLLLHFFLIKGGLQEYDKYGGYAFVYYMINSASIIP